MFIMTSNQDTSLSDYVVSVLTAFSSILLLLSGVFLHHLPSLNTFRFNFCACKLHHFLDSKVLINMLDILCFLEKA